jgi:PHD/YefM family antitoxin component YafN of YafNO toxin-antitoxin module
MHERERSVATASTISEKRGGEVETVASEEPHPVAVLARNDPEAVVLDFVQPRILGGSQLGF